MPPRPAGQRRPDFVGIGLQRSGTTWLANTLRTHPDIWIPPRKELHYFSRDPKYPTSSYLARPRSTRVAWSDLTSSNGAGRRIRRDLRHLVRGGQFRSLPWLWSYYTKQPDDAWYQRLFAPAGPTQLAGEISPDYSVLDDADVQSIAQRYPMLRALIVLRHPIDRAISHLRFAQPSLASSGDVQAMIEFVDSRGQRLRSDIPAIVRRWRSAFGDERVWIARLDEVKSDEAAVIADLAGFLGVARSGFRPARPTNAAAPGAIPAALERHLASVYRSSIDELRQLTEHDYTAWLDRCDRILAAR